MTHSATNFIAHPLVREGLDHMGQGMTIFDQNLKLVTWNRRFLDLLRFPPELAYEGADFDSFIRHNALSGEYGAGNVDAQVAERVAQARDFQPHDFERPAADGTVIRVVGAPLPSGGFVTVYTDITEEKMRKDELERRVQQRTNQLRVSEARLQLIADEVPAGIAHLDKDMNVLFANRRFAHAYGREPSQIIGKACKDVLHPETLRDSSRFFEQARRGAMVDFEMRITLPNGQRRDIRTYLRPDGPTEGDVIGFYLLSVDVTQLKAANEALLQSQKMDALGRLSSGISHDFNNLLAIVLGNLVPLMERLQDRELRTEFLEPAIAAARRGSDLTRRLLALARSEPVDPKPVQLDQAIAEMIKLLHSSLPKGIKIDHYSKVGLPPVLVDQAQLEMALLNLVMNARDAMGDKGCLVIDVDAYELTSVKADLRKLPAGPYLKICVTDTGAGISPEQRGRVFEPFYTSKSGGTGLGLAMVFGFVQQSNGAIWVDSETGEGASFTMLLPVSESAPASAREATGADQDDATDAPVKPLVLLVEDDEDVRNVVRRQLVDLGYPLIEAEDAGIALELVRSVQEIELVLSDIAMPGNMDGLALADHLSRSDPGLGVVLMSGQRATLTAKGRRVPYAFLAKPFDKPALARALVAAQNVTVDFQGAGAE